MPSPHEPLEVLDTRPLEDFLAGHAPGAAGLPAGELDARAFELPPRSARFAVVAETSEAARALVAELAARGFTAVHAASETLAADRREAGPARRALWRPSAWLACCSTTIFPRPATHRKSRVAEAPLVLQAGPNNPIRM